MIEVDVSSMSLDELKQIKKNLHTCEDKVARLGSIVVYDNQIGENLCIITDTDKIKYGIMAATLDTALGQELYLSKIGDEICPFNWPPQNSQKVIIDNILNIIDIIDIMCEKDLNKPNQIVTTNDIVLGLDNEKLALYKARGNTISDVTGLAYGFNDFSHHKIGEMVNLEKGPVKILNAITEKQFKTRILNYK